MDTNRLARPPDGMVSITRRTFGTPTFLLVVVCALLVGCSDITVHRRKALDRLPDDLASAITPPPGEPLALVQTALSREPVDPIGAIEACREGALRALPYLVVEGVSPRVEPAAGLGAQSTYRRAIEYATLIAHRQAIEEGRHWTEVLARAGIVVRGQVGAFQGTGWNEALPSRAFEVDGFRHRAERGGAGAPIVLSRRRVDESLAAERHFPETLHQAATAVLRPATSREGGLAVLELHDPVRNPEMLWRPFPEGAPLALAYDLTTPLARQFGDSKLNLVGVLGVLFPSEFDGKSGLYMMDPYQPGKIPVVFVHGLMSSPQAWTNAMNDLRGDPVLRERYQFWMFFYSTGNPILTSAARLREALLEARHEFDPGHRDAGLDRMVLVGHSMGGVLSRLAVSASGDTLWEAACKVPPEQLDIDDRLKRGMMAALHFEPIPSVSRVVFVATPHRGSPMGDQLIGRVGSSLIALPRTVTDVSTALLRSNAKDQIAPIFRDRRQLTSIAQLGQKNPVLHLVGELPMRRDVPFHSIVGYNGRGPLVEGGDGVVPYKSAHLAQARSELVVLSDHSAQENPDAIDELRRILMTHLEAADTGPSHDGPAPIRYALEPSRDPTRPLSRITANPKLLIVR